MVTESKTSAATDAGLNGDVTLVVGPEMKRLKAGSWVLKNSSKVFGAMLGPRFIEGQRLEADESTEIDMPEDDAEGMEIMLNIIHGCNNAVYDRLDAGHILRVAVMTDKFDCKAALKYSIRVWMSCAAMTTDTKELWQLLKAAYWFGEAESFEDISLGLILHHRGSYLQLWGQDDIDTDTLIKICMSLEERRHEIRQRLLRIVIEEPTFQYWNCSCGWFSKHYLEYIELLRLERLPGRIFWMPVSDAIEAVHSLGDPQPKYTEIRKCYEYVHHRRNPDFVMNVRKGVDFNKKGLCLNCVRSCGQHDTHFSGT